MQSLFCRYRPAIPIAALFQQVGTSPCARCAVSAPLGNLDLLHLLGNISIRLLVKFFLHDVQSVLFHTKQSEPAAASEPLKLLSSSDSPNSTAAAQRATAASQRSTAAAADSASPTAAVPEPTDAATGIIPTGVTLSSLKQSAQASWREMSLSTAFMLGATGAAAGVASGLLGIGGGTIVTPLLAMLTPLTQVGLCLSLQFCRLCHLSQYHFKDVGEHV